MRLPVRSLFLVAALVSLPALPAGWAAPPESPGPAAAPVAASPADVAVRDQVRSLIRQAGERMERGDRAGAATLLEQARRLRPDPSIDYNLGIVYSELGQGPEAAGALERFVATAEPGRFLPERIDDARRRLAGYRGSLARLRPRVGLPAGTRESSLSVDDRPAIPLSAGTLPEPLWVQPGMHRLRVSAPGLRDYQVAIDLGAGETREVTGELYRDELGAGLLADAPPKVDKGPQPFYKKWWFWTAVGGGAATAVALIAAGAAGAFNHVAPGSDLDAVDLAK